MEPARSCDFLHGSRPLPESLAGVIHLLVDAVQHFRVRGELALHDLRLLFEGAQHVAQLVQRVVLRFLSRGKGVDCGLLLGVWSHHLSLRSQVAAIGSLACIAPACLGCRTRLVVLVGVSDSFGFISLDGPARIALSILPLEI